MISAFEHGVKGCGRPERDGPRWFTTTHWSVVLAAGRAEEPGADEALERFCRTYWYPVYTYVRRRGHGPEDAQDLTQDFFAKLLQKSWLRGLGPRAERFRSFLLTALNRFLCNEHDRGTALKRGRGQKVFSLDEEQAEGRYSHEPVIGDTPESAFDRGWALAVMDRALSALREEAEEDGKSRQFELLGPFLSREAEPGDYERISGQTGMSVGAVGVAVRRLRLRLRESVREEVASTMADGADAEEEMRYLIAVLRTSICR
jgi:RNA polymerase sigma-70 factor (ECF subfamily)